MEVVGESKSKLRMVDEEISSRSRESIDVRDSRPTERRWVNRRDFFVGAEKGERISIGNPRKLQARFEATGLTDD